MELLTQPIRLVRGLPILQALLILLALCLFALPAVAQDSADTLRGSVRVARDRVYPALVHIVNVEEGFELGRRQRSISTGSGFFVDGEGHIVTNYHVAGKAKQLFVTLSNRTKMEAQLVAGDPYTDLAVIRVDPRLAFPAGVPLFAALGDSDALEEGDFVMAMGSPLSLSRTVSFGIVSCRDRVLGESLIEGQETGAYNTWIQTDAAINPGNSGGPLVNLRGEVVGVNTRASLGFNNIGFAIPSNVVREVVSALLRTGSVERSSLGISLQALDEVENTALAASVEGALISAVQPGSPAALADVRPGDLLVAIGESPASARFREEIPALLRRIASLPLGKPVRIALRRGEELLELQLTPERLGTRLGREAENAAWGITVQAITDKLAREGALPDASGVMVTGVRANGPAAGKFSRGDVLRVVQGRIIDGIETFQEIAARLVSESAPVIRVAFYSGGVMDVTVLRPDYSPRAEEAR